MTDAELEQELQATRAANPGDSHHLYMKEAWLLIALYQQSAGVELARQAQQVWATNRAKTPSPYGGSKYWNPWIAEAAVALAEGNWGHAEQCARVILSDYEEQPDAGYLYELALQAQGQLHPERLFPFCRDAAQELADFDLRTFALRQAGIA